MVIRNILQCHSCESKVVVRVQVGHRDKQEHSFCCPRCGVIISFVLDLDQKRGKSSFREPKNAKWVDSEEGSVDILAFSDEIPVPICLPDGFSPFILTSHNFIDRDKFSHDEMLRLKWMSSGFPYCERCRTHFERGNWDLFDKEAPPTTGEPPTPVNRLVSLYNAIQAGFSCFALNGRAKHDRIMQRLTLASTIAPDLYIQLANEFLSKGKIARLWREIAEVRKLFLASYNALQPLVQMAYWREEYRNLSEFNITDKRFDSLRQLYIDCFETLCRLMVIAIGIEAIIDRKMLVIPTKKGSITLDEFEQFTNSNKRDIIAKYPISDLFHPAIDTHFRNGIGHNSAHYEKETDEVIFYDSKNSGEIKQGMSYTEFCAAILKIFSAFELAVMYHNRLHIRLEGKFV